MTIDLANPTNIKLLILLGASILGLFTVLGIWIYRLNKAYVKSEEKAQNNLGKKLSIEELREKFPNERLRTFVIRYFIIDENNKDLSKKIGVGLVSHPKRLDLIYFVEILFKPDEEICPDSKTLYKIKSGLLIDSNFYLEKIK